MATDHRTHVSGVADADFPDRVLDALDALWAEAGEIPDVDRELFTLAVSEIATNVMQHAQGRESVRVDVDLRRAADALEAVFTDDGQPALIDLSAVDMPEWDAESGRGLALSLAALDELTHEPGEGNVWRLRRIIRTE
jgi:serine/threonine-protein kinase RsbW